MPKGKVETKPIIKEAFMGVLARKGKSIRKLDAELYERLITRDAENKVMQDDYPSDKTIRRSLKQGAMRPKYITAIAEYLDVDPRLLTGEIVGWNYNTQKDLWRASFTSKLSCIDNFPFCRAKIERIQRQKTDAYIASLLGAFSISYTQFEQLNEETRYNFLHRLFEIIESVIIKTFDQDCFGDKSMVMCHWPVDQIENAHEDYLISMSIKREFLQDPPEGYSIADIEKMSPWELLTLDYDLHYNDEL